MEQCFYCQESIGISQASLQEHILYGELAKVCEVCAKEPPVRLMIHFRRRVQQKALILPDFIPLCPEALGDWLTPLTPEETQLALIHFLSIPLQQERESKASVSVSNTFRADVLLYIQNGMKDFERMDSLDRKAILLDLIHWMY